MDIQATYTNATLELIAACDEAPAAAIKGAIMDAIIRCHGTWFDTADADVMVRGLDTLTHRIDCWLVGRDHSEPFTLHLAKARETLADLAFYIDLM